MCKDGLFVYGSVLSWTSWFSSHIKMSVLIQAATVLCGTFKWERDETRLYVDVIHARIELVEWKWEGIMWKTWNESGYCTESWVRLWRTITMFPPLLPSPSLSFPLLPSPSLSFPSLSFPLLPSSTPQASLLYQAAFQPSVCWMSVGLPLRIWWRLRLWCKTSCIHVSCDTNFPDQYCLLHMIMTALHTHHPLSPHSHTHSYHTHTHTPSPSTLSHTPYPPPHSHTHTHRGNILKVNTVDDPYPVPPTPIPVRMNDTNITSTNRTQEDSSRFGSR